MSEKKIKIGDSEFTVDELRKVTWYGECGASVMALLDHIESQPNNAAKERAAFLAGGGWRDAHCTCGLWTEYVDKAIKEAERRYPDAAQGQEQTAIPVRVCDDCGCRYTKPDAEKRDGPMVSVCPKCGGQWYEIENKPAQPQRPPVTREQVMSIIFSNADVSNYGCQQAADAIMALIGGGNETH